jgi:hypothetical protein
VIFRLNKVFIYKSKVCRELSAEGGWLFAFLKTSHLPFTLLTRQPVFPLSTISPPSTFQLLVNLLTSQPVFPLSNYPIIKLSNYHIITLSHCFLHGLAGKGSITNSYNFIPAQSRSNALFVLVICAFMLNLVLLTVTRYALHH